MSDQCCQFTMTDEDELDRPDSVVPEQTASPESGCCGTATSQAGSSCCGGSTPAGTTSITTPVA
ncbi:hypothetical protein [Cellulomonas sp. NPDC058312]|uniref:hypothetical protein n=1 Tax=Cellulomonas sp. NPDC058312 TaxID=3346441 RepID=UPI0036E51642